MIGKLVRETIGQAFPKCLDDSAVMSWPPHTQQEIFGTCLALIELAVHKLEASAPPLSHDVQDLTDSSEGQGAAT